MFTQTLSSNLFTGGIDSLGERPTRAMSEENRDVPEGERPQTDTPLKRRLDRDGMIQAEVVRRTGLAPGTISQVVNGQSEGEPNTWRLIGEALGVPWTVLVDEQDAWHKARKLHEGPASPIAEVHGMPLSDDMQELFGSVFAQIGRDSVSLLEQKPGLFVHWFNQLMILKGEDDKNRERRLKELKPAIDEFMRRKRATDGHPPSPEDIGAPE